MRELWVLALATLFLALIGAAVLADHDRQTLVAPPEAVGEQFMRQLASHRPRQASFALSERLRAELTRKRLSAWMRDIEAKAGSIENVVGKDPVVADAEAGATVVVHGSDRDVALRLGFVRERGGVWRVDRLPDYDQF